MLVLDRGQPLLGATTAPVLKEHPASGGAEGAAGRQHFVEYSAADERSRDDSLLGPYPRIAARACLSPRCAGESAGTPFNG